jgi:hypothetical protein
MKTSKYRGVSKHGSRSGQAASIRWVARFPWRAYIHYSGVCRSKSFPTEREAAIQYDKWVLELNIDRPLNILKPKK